MTSLQSAVFQQLHKNIWYALDNDLLPSAVFAAERLLAFSNKNEESIYMMALCCFREGSLRRAEQFAMTAPRHPGCVQIYAQCCLKRRKYQDGVKLMVDTKPYWVGISHWNAHDGLERRPGPDEAAMHCLLGHLHMGVHSSQLAVEAYVAALKLNPMLWEAFVGLCETGVATRVDKVFKPNKEMLKMARAMGLIPGNDFSIPEDANNAHVENQNIDPFAPVPNSKASQENGYGQPPPLSVKVNEGSAMTDLETPPGQAADSFINGPYATANGLDPQRAAPRKTRVQQFSDAPRKMFASKLKEVTDQQPQERKRTISSDSLQVPSAATTAPARRSSRLLNTTKTALSGKLPTGQREVKKAKPAPSRNRTLQLGGDRPDRAAATVASQNVDVTMTDARSLPVSLPTRVQETKSEEGLLWVLDLYKKVGNGYYALSRYKCQEALNAFHGLPTNQRETSYILSKVARAHYEMTNYSEAAFYYKRVRSMDPTRLIDMEIFSTVLWHLRTEVDLSHLAHELCKIDRNSPQAWCALGNCFSLTRDHEQALKCFKRAAQLDDTLAYAFTLQGHEHMSNDETEKAQISYRQALHADQRHYPAWYGMGKVYEKLGKYELADKHFRTAVSINPCNNVLICCVGFVLEKNKNYKAALIHYTKACELAPKSAMPKFKKARVLVALGQEHAALTELLICKDLVPDEANVHFNLGKLYKRFGDKQNSIKYFTAALHLDPKASAAIKEAIESMDTDDFDQFGNEDADSYRLMDV